MKIPKIENDVAEVLKELMEAYDFYHMHWKNSLKEDFSQEQFDEWFTQQAMPK